MKELSVRIRSILVFILFIFLLAPGLSYAANVAAEVIKIKGEVFVQRKSERISLKLNQNLYEDDVVETGNSGRIKIKLKEGGNEIVLGGDTELKIERVGQKINNSSGTVLGLNKGSVRSNVRKKYSGKGDDVYQVKTPNAVAGVRGTVFMVSFSPRNRESLIATERGAVAWKSRGREMLVAKGMFASVVGQRMSALKMIKSSPAMIKKINEVRRDAGENALPIDTDGGAQVSPDSAKAGPIIYGVKREEVSRVEFDEKGNTVVVVDEQTETNKLKRGPASVGVEGRQNTAVDVKPVNNSGPIVKPVIKAPPIQTVLIRKGDVGGVIMPATTGGIQYTTTVAREGVNDSDSPVKMDGTFVGGGIVQPGNFDNYTDIVRDAATEAPPPPPPGPRPATAIIPIGPGNSIDSSGPVVVVAP